MPVFFSLILCDVIHLCPDWFVSSALNALLNFFFFLNIYLYMEEINWKYTSRTKTTDKVGDLDQLLFQHIFIHHHPIITIDLHIVVAGSALIC